MAAGRADFTATWHTDGSIALVGGSGPSQSAPLSVEVFRPAIDMEPAGQLGVWYNAIVPGVGTLPNLYFTRSGALPVGLWLNPTNGMISGTPGETGVFRVVIEVRDLSVVPKTLLRAVTIEIR